MVDAGAFSAAYLAAKSLPTFGGPWTEKTTRDYDSDAHGYRDPVWSNSGGGAGLVSGRVTALASTAHAVRGDGRRRCLEAAGGNLVAAPRRFADVVDRRGGSSTRPRTLGRDRRSEHELGLLCRDRRSSSPTDGGANFSRVGGDELQNSWSDGSFSTAALPSQQPARASTAIRSRRRAARGHRSSSRARARPLAGPRASST